MDVPSARTCRSSVRCEEGALVLYGMSDWEDMRQVRQASVRVPWRE